MPTYEYRCTSCGQQTEAVQAFTDAPLTVCPSCGEAALRKLFGNVGVVFKGSGFYRTDSRAESKSDGAKGDGKPDGKAASDKPAGDKPAGDKPAAASGSDGAAKSGDSNTKAQAKPAPAKPAAAAV